MLSDGDTKEKDYNRGCGAEQKTVNMQPHTTCAPMTFVGRMYTITSDYMQLLSWYRFTEHIFI
ncbi:hypothetical protein DPMN_143377 [Dreissena polymorpha]|uniref:Uncharacterized protein n=1 Tax=Dreissena polymorpha TaxID=45954 RepID=A0A9D4JN54_DREPO|nr:hypothetical protein DPMN_143377 [Dreissena polymorpha]